MERDILVDKTIEYTGISTHTLTWSVTKANLPVVEERYISTHTLTWSVTGEAEHIGGEMIFQLTRSRGA